MPIVRWVFLIALASAITFTEKAVFSSSQFTEGNVWEETLWQAKDSGIDYLTSANSAWNGDPSALARLLIFGINVDAAGGLGHGVVLVGVLRQIGDAPFADAIRKRPARERARLNELLKCGLDYGPWKADPNSLSVLFPESSRAIR